MTRAGVKRPPQRLTGGRLLASVGGMDAGVGYPVVVRAWCRARQPCIQGTSRGLATHNSLGAACYTSMLGFHMQGSMIFDAHASGARSRARVRLQVCSPF